MILMPWAIHAGGYKEPYTWRYNTEKEAMEAAERLVAECNAKVYVLRITAVLSPQVRVEKCGDAGGEEQTR